MKFVPPLSSSSYLKFLKNSIAFVVLSFVFITCIQSSHFNVGFTGIRNFSAKPQIIEKHDPRSRFNLINNKSEEVENINILPNCKSSSLSLRRRTFPSSLRCSNFTTKLCMDGTFNATALVSYPGSGNTWVRYLVEAATGIFTGSVYFDETLYARGFLGEREDWSGGSTVLQKMHMKYDKRYGFTKGILLLRDPIAAAKSFVNYMEGGHTGWASPITFSKKEWPLFLLRSTTDWETLAMSWIQAPIELLVIHYENLVESVEPEVRKIVGFLGVKKDRLNSSCFLENMEGAFHRKRPYWKVRETLSPELLRIVYEKIRKVNQALEGHNKETIPLQKYSSIQSIK